MGYYQMSDWLLPELLHLSIVKYLFGKCSESGHHGLSCVFKFNVYYLATVSKGFR